MPSQGSVSHWLSALEAGDDDAAQELWERYVQRLLKLARRKLAGHPRRVADEEDVVLSAMDSFFRGQKKKQFPELRDRDNLWRLLVVITARKAVDYVQHERRQKRGGGRVAGESGPQDPAVTSSKAAIEQVIGDEATPEFAVSVAEECQRRFEQLDKEPLRTVARLKLEGYTNKEIAQQLDCSLRSVERKLWLIRKKWSDEEPADE